MAGAAPPPGGGAFFIDFNAGILGWARGPTYNMKDVSLFRLAVRQRTNSRSHNHNQALQKKGDRVARDSCYEQCQRADESIGAAGDSDAQFHEKYENRASSKTYLAYVADIQGVSSSIVRAGWGATTFNDHEKADVIEAIIGAVEQDSAGTATEDVLRAFAIFYPVTQEEEDEVERIRSEAAKRYMAERSWPYPAYWQAYWNAWAAHWA